MTIRLNGEAMAIAPERWPLNIDHQRIAVEHNLTIVKVSMKDSTPPHLVIALAFLAGRFPRRRSATASSPAEGLIGAEAGRATTA